MSAIAQHLSAPGQDRPAGRLKFRMNNPCWARVFLNLRFGGLNLKQAGPNSFIAPLMYGAKNSPLDPAREEPNQKHQVDRGLENLRLLKRCSSGLLSLESVPLKESVALFSMKSLKDSCE